MTLQEQTKTALASHAHQAGPHRLDFDEGGDRVTAELSSIDTLACEFAHLTLQTPKLAGAPAEGLQALAKSLAQRLTYLLEPIAPIEADAEGCTVQMRSNPPQRGEEGTSYYELLVRRGGELDLRRWKKAPGGTRTPLNATVTREVFLRLVGDLAAAVE
jgi:hypothetical protein